LDEAESPVVRIAVLARTLHAESADSEGFVELVAHLLLDILPRHTVVDRAGGMLKRQRPIRLVTVSLGEDCFRIVRGSGDKLAAERLKVVRGITLRSEQKSLGQWIDELTAAVAAEADQSIEARTALKRFLAP
jgi:hypothetical protein